MKRLLWLLPLFFLLSCDDATIPDQRFDTAVYGVQGAQTCMYRVITDKKTGCQYLMVCNGLTVMPHTCFLDKALTDKTLGN